MAIGFPRGGPAPTLQAAGQAGGALTHDLSAPTMKRRAPLTSAEVTAWVKGSMAAMLNEQQLLSWHMPMGAAHNAAASSILRLLGYSVEKATANLLRNAAITLSGCVDFCSMAKATAAGKTSSKLCSST